MSTRNTKNSIVSITKCSGYGIADVYDSVSRSIEHVGGIEHFVKPGQRVLLKPNMLSAKRPERAITTHPSVIEAVAKIVTDCGGYPVIGDSPGGVLRGVKRVWENTGIEEMARRIGVELVNFEASGSVEVKSGDYLFYIAKPVIDADVIINIAKLKTHTLTLLTCALKNMFGTVCGFRKSELHKEFPKPREFARMLVELYSKVRPSLSIVDAVVAMEGDGPSSGNPKKLGLVIAGEDAVAIDAVAARIIGFKPGSIDTTRMADEIKLGVGDIESIQVTGDGKEVRPVSFDLPSNRKLRMIPRPLARMISPFVWLKLIVDPSVCTGCRLCQRSCPVEAISYQDGVCGINNNKCITCMCCHELCPEDAIEIKMSRLAKLVT
ncbi:MAG: DUF362 domain-containing protein [Candidatus Krumholzibacteriota bacterium]|nr:DUF362 domain-containing protein [Candidatus Krumholzibacteriota bacterium]